MLDPVGGRWAVAAPLCLVLLVPVLFFARAHQPIDGTDVRRGGERVPSRQAVYRTVGTAEAGAFHTRPGGTDAVSTSTCSSCHETTNGFVQDPDHFLNARAALDRQAWADSVQLLTKCGSCHLVPGVDELPPDRWQDALVNFMSKVMYYRDQAPGFEPPPAHQAYGEWMQLTRLQWTDLLHYFYTFSGSQEALPFDPPNAGVRFDAASIGQPTSPRALSQIAHVNVVDLDADGRPDLLVSDFERHAVSWIRRGETGWEERPLARAAYPGPTQVGDFDGDGHLDIVVAEVGSSTPTDNTVGRVLLLTGDGELRFEPRILLEGVGRVADVRPGDFDQDGDVDFVVGVFGFLKQGEIGWLERQDDGTFAYHRLSEKAGAVHVPPIDLDGDGRLDFVALIAQEYEEVAAFINQGGGRFAERTLFKAESPTFGSSGIELTDLDGDGDADILYTNGDAFDLSKPMIRPYHGVQWLENQGDLRFEYHDLMRFYGAYRAIPADLDADGDLDVVATSLLNDWSDPTRQSLLWLENDGRQHFTPRGIGNAPTALITADVADFDGDGRLDIVTGSMHMYPTDPRRGRVTLWTNLGTTE